MDSKLTKIFQCFECFIANFTMKTLIVTKCKARLVMHGISSSFCEKFMYNEGIFEEMLLHSCYHASVITNHYFPVLDDPVVSSH